MSISHDKDRHALNQRSLTALHERRTMADYSGMIERSLVEDILELEGKGIEELLVGLLPIAAASAYTPISKYDVGTACLGASGNIYLGCNIEIPGQALGTAVHGEQCAFSNAFGHKEEEIKAIAVTAAPCGHCRQFMAEFSIAMDLTIIIKDTVETSLGHLLPEHFGPSHLGNRRGVMQCAGTELQLSGTLEASALEKAALEAAARSYAPYSQSPSGVAVRTTRGHIYSGAYIENVAFNPSLPPLQAALVAVVQAGELPDDIVECVLLELGDAKITQRDLTRAVLNALPTDAELKVVHARRA